MRFQKEGTNTSPAYVSSQIALGEETIEELVQVLYNIFVHVIIHAWYESNEYNDNFLYYLATTTRTPPHFDHTRSCYFE